ncbi:MAG TPA: glycine--tRNA ligase subunit beta [Burkholderiales bacterium]|nr:glycine--tRNA ligase subunit beta [Burkholderiales bacterium]
MEAPLLIELLTEELPPKSVRKLGEAFAEAVVAEIVKHRLKDSGAVGQAFASPRRLAVLLSDVRAKGLESSQSIEGPQSSNAKAVEGFARKHKLTPESLARVQTPRGEIVVARLTLPGAVLDQVLPEIIESALRRLPVAKMMRWGAGEAQFVRPVHGLVMMHGSRVIPGSVLGVEAGSRTRGHRFLSAGDIALNHAGEYEARLRDEGKVIADFSARRSEIERQLAAEAGRLGAGLGDSQGLLDEVTGLVEYPRIYVGKFDAAFLEVPQECLILTMRQNQKYFPLFDPDGKLLPQFLIVSNMAVDDPRNIVAGNERVVRPRLEDARFFYRQDRKLRLESRVPQLARVVYHNKLGSQLERVERIQLLTGRIARELHADPVLAERAAWLSKADLLSGMVGEFPELQGVMGRYYALADGEPAEIADAIEMHYRPRYAGDRLPQSKLASAVALADKLDTLAGMFGIGQQPSGDRDPYGLRRAALGVLRILVENVYSLSLHDLVNAAFDGYDGRIGDARTVLEMFLSDRLAGYLRERGYTALEVEAVLSLNPARIDLIPRQLEAVRAFLALPEAESLAAANKRVANILKQAQAKGESFIDADSARFREPAERALFEALKETSGKAAALYDCGDYTGYLRSFAVLKSPVDAFFDSVMVMVDDAGLRRNRLALLADLRREMNRVADISRLAA